MKIRILDKFVIIRTDGGVCSQMHFYMIGRYFERQGYRVKYSLDWFRENGYDMNGEYVYNFDLIKAFPDIQIELVNRSEQFLYGIFIHLNDYFDKNALYDWMKLAPPVYLKGYYNTPVTWYKDFKSFFKINESVLDEPNQAMLDSIRGKSNSVAVHVRLGDLSGYNPAYGSPVSVSYFRRSMEYIESRKGPCHYYFFSVNPQWIRESLIPELGMENNYTIVSLNGSDKGYMDLILMSFCRNQITSKGTLGKYAGFLCEQDNNIITVFDDDYERHVWDGADGRIVFIKDRQS